MLRVHVCRCAHVHVKRMRVCACARLQVGGVCLVVVTFERDYVVQAGGCWRCAVMSFEKKSLTLQTKTI